MASPASFPTPLQPAPLRQKRGDMPSGDVYREVELRLRTLSVGEAGILAKHFGVSSEDFRNTYLLLRNLTSEQADQLLQYLKERERPEIQVKEGLVERDLLNGKNAVSLPLSSMGGSPNVEIQYASWLYDIRVTVDGSPYVFYLQEGAARSDQTNPLLKQVSLAIPQIPGQKFTIHLEPRHQFLYSEQGAGGIKGYHLTLERPPVSDSAATSLQEASFAQRLDVMPWVSRAVREGAFVSFTVVGPSDTVSYREDLKQKGSNFYNFTAGSFNLGTSSETAGSWRLLGGSSSVTDAKGETVSPFSPTSSRRVRQGALVYYKRVHLKDLSPNSVFHRPEFRGKYKTDPKGAYLDFYAVVVGRDSTHEAITQFLGNTYSDRPISFSGVDSKPLHVVPHAVNYAGHAYPAHMAKTGADLRMTQGNLSVSKGVSLFSCGSSKDFFGTEMLLEPALTPVFSVRATYKGDPSGYMVAGQLDAIIQLEDQPSQSHLSQIIEGTAARELEMLGRFKANLSPMELENRGEAYAREKDYLGDLRLLAGVTQFSPALTPSKGRFDRDTPYGDRPTAVIAEPTGYRPPITAVTP